MITRLVTTRASRPGRVTYLMKAGDNHRWIILSPGKAHSSGRDNVRAQTKDNIAWADRLGSQLAKADHARIVVLPPATGKLE